MRRDTEFDAIRRILALLTPLAPSARARVLTYVAGRLASNVDVTTMATPTRSNGQHAVDDRPGTHEMAQR